LGDRETGSFWQHLTGRCVYGPLQGHRLDGFPLLHTDAGGALSAYPAAQIALSRLSLWQRAIIRGQEGTLGLLGGRLPPGFQLTMGKEDRRLPRMERGLAVWTERTQRFYPTATLRAHDNALIDEIDGRRALVYLDPTCGTLGCMRLRARAGACTDATVCNWQDGTLVLDTGERIRRAVLYDAQGTALSSDRPMQSITCWYVYAFTFPGGEVYTG
jgi:hypothetical protein